MTTCPYCTHNWDQHIPRCRDCGCYWTKPKLTPLAPTARQQLIERVTDILWSAFEVQDDICVDRKMDLIDTSGWTGVDMAFVATVLIDQLGLNAEKTPGT